ncbi:MAG: L,D-transpeptidase [Limisphaerales bacterium]
MKLRFGRNTPTSDNVLSEFINSCENDAVHPTPFLLIVSVAAQTVSLFENTFAPSSAVNASHLTADNYKFLKEYSCSTSRFGVGQSEGSNCTPLRLHRIAEKIGAGMEAGTVFKGRKVIGHVSQPELAKSKITTRIMWLEGLEQGFNRGGNVDSHARYIYIHGTADQASIGKPDSCGCIHLADADLITLFDTLPGGTLVWITECSLTL